MSEFLAKAVADIEAAKNDGVQPKRLQEQPEGQQAFGPGAMAGCRVDVAGAGDDRDSPSPRRRPTPGLARRSNRGRSSWRSASRETASAASAPAGTFPETSRLVRRRAKTLRSAPGARDPAGQREMHRQRAIEQAAARHGPLPSRRSRAPPVPSDAWRQRYPRRCARPRPRAPGGPSHPGQRSVRS